MGYKDIEYISIWDCVFIIINRIKKININIVMLID
jgi:hypothetical protein